MMKGLECPYCSNQVFKVWKLCLLPPLFFVNIRCMHCHNQVKINWKVLLNVLVGIAVAAIVGLLIDKVYSFDFILFDIFLYLFAAYVPFLAGQKLFSKCEEQKDNS